MQGFRSVGFAAAAAAALLLSGCGEDDTPIIEYAKTHNLNKAQMVALKACAKDFRRNKPVYFQVPKGNLVMKEVPLDVCACQTATMMTVFPEGEYKPHEGFATFMATNGKRRAPFWSREELQKGLKLKAAQTKLVEGFAACADTYKKANAEASKELFEFVPVEEKKKKEKKKHDGAAS